MSFVKILMGDEYSGVTENGALSHAGSGDGRVDLFFKMCRGMKVDDLFTGLEGAWFESDLDTLKIVFQARDCRGGKGERDLFINAMEWMYREHKDVFKKNLKHVVEYGRWDDLLKMAGFGDDVKIVVCKEFADQLMKDLELLKAGGYGVSLCAKWAPTEGKKWDKKFGIVGVICSILDCDKRNYRTKYLSPLRDWLNIVEKFMCGGRWSAIDYSKVPSRAMMRLKGAFEKHDSVRFGEWKAGLASGATKVNSSQIFPHELCLKYYNGGSEDVVTEEQWKAQVATARELGTFSKSLTICDVSGSMGCDGGIPMAVSIALGIMISELCDGEFNGTVITFSERPEFFKLDNRESLKKRCTRLSRAPWGGSTNFQAVFDMILSKAVKAKLMATDMPKTLFVISDMQFNMCGGGGTNFDTVRAKYRAAGYQMPQIVFWNVHGRIQDSPVRINDKGVCLISGFSPAIMKSVLSADSDSFTPMGIMKTAIDDERYARLEV